MKVHSNQADGISGMWGDAITCVYFTTTSRNCRVCSLVAGVKYGLSVGGFTLWDLPARPGEPIEAGGNSGVEFSLLLSFVKRKKNYVVGCYSFVIRQAVSASP